LRGDAGEAVDIFLEVETAIEAPLITDEIPLGVLRVEGSSRNVVLLVMCSQVRETPTDAFPDGSIQRQAMGTPLLWLLGLLPNNDRAKFDANLAGRWR
jgi:hypothetical protein